jgi:hypothetical protein
MSLSNVDFTGGKIDISAAYEKNSIRDDCLPGGRSKSRVNRSALLFQTLPLLL